MSKKEYILKPGYEHHGFDQNGDRHVFVGGEKGNDRVELTPNQAKAFSDRFVSVAEMRERAALQGEATRASEEINELKQKLLEAGIDPAAVLRGEVSLKTPKSDDQTTQTPTPTPTATTSPTPTPVISPPGVKSK